MSFPGLRGFSVKQTRSGKADGPLVGSRSPAGSCKAPDTGAVMKETAAAGADGGQLDRRGCSKAVVVPGA
jgi:hypothetical protein